nr:MAG TPA: hypothetical protein [Caudoviricetes sp.]
MIDSKSPGYPPRALYSNVYLTFIVVKTRRIVRMRTKR